MKYLDIYNRILEEGLLKSKEIDDGNENMKNDWILITEGLKEPMENPRFFEKKIREEYGINVDIKYIKNALREINLNSPDKRLEMLQKVKEMAVVIKNMLNGDKVSINKMSDFLESGIEKDERGRIRFKYKCLLVYIFNLDNELKNPKYNEILTVFREVYCKNILKKLYKNISIKEGIYRKEDVAKVTERIQKTINSTSTQKSRIDCLDDKDKLIENLNFEIENYKNTIEILQSVLDDLKDSIDDVAKEAEKKAVSSFFVKLNSPQYGNILDNLLIVENKLKEVRNLNSILPNQLIALPIIFKQLVKFVKDVGIMPIDLIGRNFEAAYRDIDLMNYNGDPFMNDDEIKNMEIQKCGWKYEDIIISMPTVKELTDF